MDPPPIDRHILDWDESDVHNWFSTLGYPQYERQIRGSVLPIPTLRRSYSPSRAQNLRRCSLPTRLRGPQGSWCFYYWTTTIYPEGRV
jgi:hypothetical protein